MSDWNDRPKHLRLVTNDPPTKRPQRKGLVFTPEQRARLASVLRNLWRRYGTYKKVAEAMGMSIAALHLTLSGRGGSMMMAVRAAHLAGIPVDTIIYGTVLATDRCAHCGQKLPEKNP
jgi:hypothetical protein